MVLNIAVNLKCDTFAPTTYVSLFAARERRVSINFLCHFAVFFLYYACLLQYCLHAW